MHVFTSITSNYIPKARVLAASVKKFHPEAQFHLVLSDDRPDWLGEEDEPFDSVIMAQDLPVPDFHPWIFKHTLVEMCTAVKGAGFQYIFDKFDAKYVFYFDPDMALFSTLESLLKKFETASVLLTPHQAEPEESIRAIVDNEICSLKHGVFNLGFLAVKNSGEGRRFIDWWAARLSEFCYDDIAGGLFTDQRWVDLAPCFFEDIHVAREPIYNVATWNLTHRQAIGSIKDGVMINGLPLCFYHFSGFDSGAQEIMLGVYGGHSPVLQELRDWYIAECEKMGQEEYGKTPCKYGNYDNGEPIKNEQRYLYRARLDLQKAFPDPFSAGDVKKSYFHWYKNKFGDVATTEVSDPSMDNPESLRARLVEMRRELDLIYGSKTWRVASGLRRLVKPFRP